MLLVFTACSQQLRLNFYPPTSTVHTGRLIFAHALFSFNCHADKKSSPRRLKRQAGLKSVRRTPPRVLICMRITALPAGFARASLKTLPRTRLLDPGVSIFLYLLTATLAKDNGTTTVITVNYSSSQNCLPTLWNFYGRRASP